MQKSSRASIIKREKERKKDKRKKNGQEFNENGSKSYAIVKNSVIYVEIQEQTPHINNKNNTLTAIAKTATV